MRELGQEAAVRRHHAAFFTALAVTAESKLRSGDQLIWLTRLDHEAENVRAGLAWTLDEGADPAAGLRLAGGLWYYWFLRGRFTEAMRWLRGPWVNDVALPLEQRVWAQAAAAFIAEFLEHFELSAPLSEAIQPLADMCPSLHVRAFARCQPMWTYELPGMGERAREAIRLAEAAQDPWLQAYARVRYAYLHPGEYPAERIFYEQTIARARHTGDRWLIGYTLLTLSLTIWAAGEVVRARENQEEAYELRCALRDRLGMAFSLDQLGNIAIWEGNYAAGITYYTQQLAIMRELGNPIQVASTLEELGTVAIDQNDYQRAEALLSESWEVSAAAGGDTLFRFAIVLDRCRVACRRGKYAEARALLATAPSVRVAPLVPDEEVVLTEYAARIACGEGNLAEARALLEQVLAHSRVAPGKAARLTRDRGGATWAQRMLGLVMLAMGDSDSALTALELSLASARTRQHALSQAEGCLSLATALLARGEATRAKPLLNEAVRRYRTIGSPLGVALTIDVLGAYMQQRGDNQGAAQWWGAAEAIREQMGAIVWPVERQSYTPEQGAARAALGEETFRAAWASGRELHWDKAGEMALASLQDTASVGMACS